MDSALAVHRLHFAFTVAFHYIFPQLTMGLAFLIVVLKTLALRSGGERYSESARFWAKIFGINFAMGVVTGIPMEFQFGTNWAVFSKAAGGVIGQTLAMEGVFSFFLESTFLGLFLFGEKKLGPKLHWVAAFLVFLGSWLSGYFIIATDAWMQHPTGYVLGPGGEILLSSFWGLVLNPWILWQYLHNMVGAVVTASFVMAGLGAFYLLSNTHVEHARIFVRTGVWAGLAATLLMIFPTGDGQGKMLARYQPVTLAAMEGLFVTTSGAPLVLIGQPDTDRLALDNPILIPRFLSFLTYMHWEAEVKGLTDFPRDNWPDNIPLIYYSYHIMVGLGTMFIALMLVAGLLLWRGTLFETRPILWVLMLAIPFPYIATLAGWIVSGGRPPTLVDLRPDANHERLFHARVRRERAFHTDWIYGPLPHSGTAVSVPGGTRDRAWTACGGARMMPVLWFWLVAVAIAGYVVLDGFDLGAGFVSLFLARNDAERQQVLSSIGPVWDGNEVWLLAGGGTLYFAFPALYASAFSGFYLALMIVLWLLILRGISIEIRSHVESSTLEVPLGCGLWRFECRPGAALRRGSRQRRARRSH